MLIEQAKKGDAEAFYHLIHQKKTELYRMAYVYVQNENDAVDIYQQTIIRAFEGLPKLHDPTYFSTWITRILINCSKTYLSKQKNVELVEPVHIENLRSMSHSNIEEHLDLWQALQLLDEKYKTVLLLRFYQDYSVNQIADIIQCPEGTVKTHIRRGLHMLRQQLKGAYIDEWVQSVERNN
ncbi:sigma-70 family RNA polymerase sigma factor [Paenibacillus paeoniae]|uniref:sigma-70 family RNA polymerase sigma factor n=1 Tax=Paenibacillus paeoniae TaxID=2292705 RepID=UPI001F0C6FF5|nr:sigma-70 family RNA polymerase sigma factor [Paenibacillus paeoniae]